MPDTDSDPATNGDGGPVAQVDGAPAGEKTEQVALPAQLVRRVEQRLQYTTYDDAGEYVAFVVAQTLARVDDPDGEPVEFDEEEVRDRLESLGYVDS
jgi:hypothetical protein